MNSPRSFPGAWLATTALVYRIGRVVLIYPLEILRWGVFRGIETTRQIRTNATVVRESLHAVSSLVIRVSDRNVHCFELFETKSGGISQCR